MGADFVIVAFLFFMLFSGFRLIGSHISSNFEVKAKQSFTGNYYVFKEEDYNLELEIKEENKQPVEKKADSLKTIVVSKGPRVETAAFDTAVSDGSQVENHIKTYADIYGIDANLMKNIAYCESGFRPNAVNGPYAGVYQFLASTWVSNRRAMGLDPNPALRFNPEEAARTAAFKMSRDGFGAWPVCSRKSLNKI